MSTPESTVAHALTAPGGEQLAALFTGERALEAAMAWAGECHAMREILSARGAAWRRGEALRSRKLRHGGEGERAAGGAG